MKYPKTEPQELDNYVWGDREVFHWLQALSLPTLSWASPFVPLMGLPNPLLEQPQVLEPIYTQAVIEYETRLKSGNWTPTPDGGRGERRLRSVKKKVERRLARAIGCRKIENVPRNDNSGTAKNVGWFSLSFNPIKPLVMLG